MKGYVITIMDMPRSVGVAQRCIDSASAVGLSVEFWPAVTPTDLRFQLFPGDPERFESKYCRRDQAIGCFTSHFLLWKKCLEEDTSFIILEHDAVFQTRLPKTLFTVKGACNLGRPSHGKFKIPGDGFRILESKHRFAGTHAYYITPWGASRLISAATFEAEASDVFMNLKRFPWLLEYYPWPVTAEDSFTTIQNRIGCLANPNEIEII